MFRNYSDDRHDLFKKPDGKELFYLEGRTLMSVQIKMDGDRLVAAAPRPHFSVNVEERERRNRYLVTRDGLFLAVDTIKLSISLI
jgi:hypothetical protein